MSLSPVAQYHLRAAYECEMRGGDYWVTGAVGKPWVKELCPKLLISDVPTFMNSGPGQGSYFDLTQAGREAAKALPPAIELVGKTGSTCDAPDGGE